MKRSLQQTLTDTNNVTIYKSKKLTTKFNVKDNSHKVHKHNVIYKASCPEPMCNATYIRKTAHRLDQHGGKDNNPCFFRHFIDTSHAMVNSNNFKTMAKGSKHTYTRKITEAVYIKLDKPSLNVQTMSVPF